MLLSPYRVLDLTGSLGFLTGKIFGDLGADVIKVEPPGGDAAAEQAGRIYYQRVLDQMVRDIERNVDRSALQRGRALFSLS